jgi:hypothetical protein
MMATTAERVRLERVQTATRQVEDSLDPVRAAVHRISDAKKGFILWQGIGILVAAYALFCHGCHGDKDNELFASRGPSGPIASNACRDSRHTKPKRKRGPCLRIEEPWLSPTAGIRRTIKLDQNRGTSMGIGLANRPMFGSEDWVFS